MPSGYWDIMIKKRDIMFLKWGYWDIILGVPGPYSYNLTHNKQNFESGLIIE